MSHISFEVPEDALRAASDSPKEFACALRLAAAMYWYGKGTVSQDIAASIAGLDRTEFIFALAKAGQDVVVVDFDDLDRELAGG